MIRMTRTSTYRVSLIWSFISHNMICISFLNWTHSWITIRPVRAYQFSGLYDSITVGGESEWPYTLYTIHWTVFSHHYNGGESPLVMLSDSSNGGVCRGTDFGFSSAPKWVLFTNFHLAVVFNKCRLWFSYDSVMIQLWFAFNSGWRIVWILRIRFVCHFLSFRLSQQSGNQLKHSASCSIHTAVCIWQTSVR